MWKLAVILAVLPLGACGSSGPLARRAPGPVVGWQGSGSEVVFHGVGIGGAGEQEGAELARRDASLNAREVATVSALDSWPAAPVPSLDEARYLHLPRNPRTYLYFNRAHPNRHDHAEHLHFYWRSWE